MGTDSIIVLDFGSQYNQLIARRIREMGVYSELLPYTTSAKEIQAMPNVKGIVLSGGPHSVYDENSFQGDSNIFQLGLPVLGICYGMQWMAQVFGGIIGSSSHREYGRQTIELLDSSLLTDQTSMKQTVWMSHGDQVKQLPNEFRQIASSPTCPYAVIEHVNSIFYGVQFHPEVQHSEFGNKMLQNFVFTICQAKKEWSMQRYIEQQIQQIRSIVKNGRVLMGVSGGVDSSVAAVLIHRAIGDHLTCMFIDHGLLRKDESEQVVATLKEAFHIDLKHVDASKRFLSRLKGVKAPEEKRKIIGNEFVYVFEEEAKKLGDFTFLGQGTLYTDVIESGTATAQTIKSHHNVGGLPKDMKLVPLEPLNKLFKDEVRALGRELGIPNELVMRQPFPGPGLGIRILGEVDEEKLIIVRESDAILREEFIKAGLDRSVWQYFTVVPDIRSVGVMGDQRTYDHTVVIRAVTSIDGMTADWARIPYEVLEAVSRRIINEVKHCNRIVYDITAKPPATIEWE